MSKLNFLIRNKNNINFYLYTGIVLFSLSVIIVLFNSFFNLDLIFFLPETISFFLPLVIGFIGLNFVRIEYLDIKFLNLVNKNINTNKFNALLSLLIIFLVIKSLPPLLSWFIIDANFRGLKDACSGSGACWAYIKTWFNRFMYGMYPNEEQWRINLSFISLGFLGVIGFFATEKFKKYSNTLLCVVYPVIAFSLFSFLYLVVQYFLIFLMELLLL